MFKKIFNTNVPPKSGSLIVEIHMLFDDDTGNKFMSSNIFSNMFEFRIRNGALSNIVYQEIQKLKDIYNRTDKLPTITLVRKMGIHTLSDNEKDINAEFWGQFNYILQNFKVLDEDRKRIHKLEEYTHH